MLLCFQISQYESFNREAYTRSSILLRLTSAPPAPTLWRLTNTGSRMYDFGVFIYAHWSWLISLPCPEQIREPPWGLDNWSETGN